MIYYHSHPVLNGDKLIYGIRSESLGMCWGVAGSLALLPGLIYGAAYALPGLALGMVWHGVLRHLYRKDALIFKMYRHYARFGNVYHPYPAMASRQAARPQGWCQGVRN